VLQHVGSRIMLSNWHAGHTAQLQTVVQDATKHLVPQDLALQAKLLVFLQEGGVRPTNQGGSN